jgi:prepilin-type N-terminal cleavage/methylation domain-containing protein
MINKSNNNKGFTIVELLIAVALFSVVISITSGVFIRSLRTQRIITSFIAANSNASLAMEQMAREIRTGQDFCSGPNIGCAADSGIFQELIFTNARGQQAKYELSEPRTIGLNTIQSIMRSADGGTPLPVTADNVNINYFSFYLTGHELGDGGNPRITITLGIGATGVPFSDALINLQTTVSSRVVQD